MKKYIFIGLFILSNMETFIKSRNDTSGLKLYLFNNSVDEYRRHEIDMMNSVREVYKFIPKVIQCNENNLIVEKVEGRSLDIYIKETTDISILDKLRKIVTMLNNTVIDLSENYESQKSKGYIFYLDYIPENFIVDNDKNIWFIDWDASILADETFLTQDRCIFNGMCEDLSESIE